MKPTDFDLYCICNITKVIQTVILPEQTGECEMIAFVNARLRRLRKGEAI